MTHEVNGLSVAQVLELEVKCWLSFRAAYPDMSLSEAQEEWKSVDGVEFDLHLLAEFMPLQ